MCANNYFNVEKLKTTLIDQFNFVLNRESHVEISLLVDSISISLNFKFVSISCRKSD